MRVAIVGMKMMHYETFKSSCSYTDLKSRLKEEIYLGP